MGVCVASAAPALSFIYTPITVRAPRVRAPHRLLTRYTGVAVHARFVKSVTVSAWAVRARAADRRTILCRIALVFLLRRHIAGSCICRASARQVPSRTSSHSNIIRPNVVWRSHTDTETHAQRLPSLSLYTGHSLRDRRSLLERVLSLSLSFSRVCSRRAWCCRWQAPGHPRTRSWPLALMMHAGITLASSRRACCRWRAPAPPCRRWRSWRGGRY